MKNILIIILLILLIIASFFGIFFYFKFKELSQSGDNSLKIYNKSFNKNEVKDIFINSNVINILIEENKNTENIEISARYYSYNELLVNVENNILKIEEHKISSNKHINFSCVKEYIKISLPKDVANKLQIDSNVGDIEISETLFNNLNIKSNVGNIKFIAKEFPDNTNITTTVGNVSINIPKPNNYMLKAYASVGKVNIYENTKKRNVLETLGEGAKKISIDSNVGNINIYHKEN